MNTHVQHLWIDALATYAQTTGQLRDGNAFCVGGVLCDLHSQATGEPWIESPFDESACWTYLNNAGFVPKEVLMWAQLHQDDFLPIMDGNDDGMTFPELARRIAAL